MFETFFSVLWDFSLEVTFGYSCIYKREELNAVYSFILHCFRKFVIKKFAKPSTTFFC